MSLTLSNPCTCLSEAWLRHTKHFGQECCKKRATIDGQPNLTQTELKISLDGKLAARERSGLHYVDHSRPPVDSERYRGTSLMRNHRPPLGPP